MDIQVARFREVLAMLKPVVPRKTTLPILTNVLLKDGQAVATDLETMVVIPVPEVDDPCLLPYIDTVNLLQYVQGGESLHIEAKKGHAKMTWPEGTSTLESKDVNDFPPVPDFVPVAEAPLNIGDLISAMVSVLPYAAVENDRPVLSGVTLIMGEPFEVAAGDGFRMAYQVLPMSFPQNVTAVMPTASVIALANLLKRTPSPPPASDDLIRALVSKKQATVAFDGKTGLRFVFGQTVTAIVKLIEGSPPAWVRLIPKDEPTLQCRVMASELELVARRALKLALAGKKPLRLVFDNDTITVSAKSDGQEVSSSIKTFSTRGAPSRIGLEVTYLLEYLKGKTGIVTMSLTNDKSPLMFQHQHDPRVLIMPMLVDW